MKNPNLLYSDVAGKIIGCAANVHAALGYGKPLIDYKKELLKQFKESDLVSKELHDPVTLPIDSAAAIHEYKFVVAKDFYVKIESETSSKQFDPFKLSLDVMSSGLKAGFFFTFRKKGLEIKGANHPDQTGD
jgi:hypothetical protein